MSEIEYIECFRQQLRSPLVHITPVGLGADPKTVVSKAKALREENLTESRRADDPNILFDEIWCAFDRDDHPTWDAALQMAEANSLRLATSNPSSELWLLLHFQPNPGMQDRKVIVQLLKRHVPNYDKHIDFEVFWSRWQDAARCAERMDWDAIDANETHRNPTTGFYCLMRSIHDGSGDH